MIRLVTVHNYQGEENEVAVPSLPSWIGNYKMTKLKDVAERNPDGQIRFHDNRWPPLVIEIVNSQDPKDILKLAHQYIIKTGGYRRIHE